MPISQSRVIPLNLLGSYDVNTVNDDLAGRHGDKYVSEVHGKWFHATVNGMVWTATATGITIPVVAANLVSTYTIQNPLGNNKVFEMISTDIGIVLATQVVNHYGWYKMDGIGRLVVDLTSKTLGTPQNRALGQAGAPTALFLTAGTFTGTPTLVDIVATTGAVTTTGNLRSGKDHDGSLLVFPGETITFASSTAASTASGMAVQTSWAEWPL